MQYDENAEKYGYDGEMTPLKCDKLTAYKGDVTIPVYGTIADADVYLKKEADEAIAELKEFAEDACIERDDNQTAIDELQAENAELKQKLEDAQATAYAESVDAGMRERRLKRALWLARAEWARSSALSYHLIESHPDKDAAATYKRKANKWEKAKDKCLKKAEEYK